LFTPPPSSHNIHPFPSAASSSFICSDTLLLTFITRHIHHCLHLAAFCNSKIHMPVTSMTNQWLFWHTGDLHDIPLTYMKYGWPQWHTSDLYDIPVTYVKYRWPLWHTSDLHDMPVTFLTYQWPPWHTGDLHDIQVTSIKYRWPPWHTYRWPPRPNQIKGSCASSLSFQVSNDLHIFQPFKQLSSVYNGLYFDLFPVTKLILFENCDFLL